MKITAVYFSATETTKKNVLSIAGALGGDVHEIDVTLPGDLSADFGPDDLVIFGTPCYGGRVPNLAAQRFEGFKGHNTPAIAVVTYGNRDFDDAIVELADLADARGFITVAAAAVIGQHTYGTIAVGRPDANDLALNADFAKKVKDKLAGGVSSITASLPGNRPYKDGGKGGAFRPQTTDACVSCGLCAAQCPTAAIGDDFRTIDNDKCIACFRCIRFCPVKAKVMDTPAYNEFAVGFSQKLAEPKTNRYFI